MSGIKPIRHSGRSRVGRQDRYRPMKRLQLAHLPLRTKLVAASALMASIALLIAALTQGVTSYFYSHNEAYEHLHAVARVIAGRSTAAIQSQDFGQAEALVSALRVEPNVEEALLIDSRKARAHALRRQQDPADAPASRANSRRSSNGSRRPSRAATHQHRFDGLTALHLVYPITDQGKRHRPPVRARQPVGAAGSAAGAAGHPARQLGASRWPWPIYWPAACSARSPRRCSTWSTPCRPPSAATIRGARRSPRTTKSAR